MTTLKALVTKHAVAAYFALTYVISWGGFVLVVGPGGFPGTGSQFDTLLPLVASAMLAVSARWYALALLPAPLLAATVLFALSLTSPIFAADNRAALLL